MDKKLVNEITILKDDEDEVLIQDSSKTKHKIQKVNIDKIIVILIAIDETKFDGCFIPATEIERRLFVNKKKMKDGNFLRPKEYYDEYLNPLRYLCHIKKCIYYYKDGTIQKRKIMDFVAKEILTKIDSENIVDLIPTNVPKRGLDRWI